MISSVGNLAHLALADFRERTRRYSFLLILGVNLYLSYLIFAGKFTVRLGMCRGAANSAWTGSTIVMTCVLLLAMFGFYLVKNAVSRDRATGVGEILASTPLSRIGYVSGKFVSNFAALTAMLLIIAVSAVALQLLAGIDGGFDLWALLAPFVVIGMPVMAVVAATAIFFESVRWLRGGLGNAIYFILTMSMLPLSLETESPLLDLLGFRLFQESMSAAAAAQFPSEPLGLVLNPEYIANLKVFYWSGIDWNAAIILPHLFWVGVALLIAGMAVPFFDRFDPARTRRRSPAKAAAKRDDSKEELTAPAATCDHYQVLDFVPHFNLAAMVKAELRLAVKGFPNTWYLVFLGLLIAQFAAPFEAVRAYIVPVTFAWPLVIWSSMGTREARHNTGQLLFSSVHPITRQLPALWIAGLLVAVACGVVALIRAALSGNWGYLVALLIGAFFVSSLALALGTLSGTNRLFEIVYMTIWYIGPLNHMPIFDFLGATEVSVAEGYCWYYLVFALLSLPTALIARRGQACDVT